MMLYPVPPAGAGEAAEAGIELTVMSPADLESPAGRRGSRRRPVAGPSRLETGLGRGGLSPSEMLEMAAAASADPRFGLAGLWTHLASPDDAEASLRQAARFDDAAAALTHRGIATPPRHLAASGGLFAGTAPPYDLVRQGLAMYGVLDQDLPIAVTRATQRQRPCGPP